MRTSCATTERQSGISGCFWNLPTWKMAAMGLPSSTNGGLAVAISMTVQPRDHMSACMGWIAQGKRKRKGATTIETFEAVVKTRSMWQHLQQAHSLSAHLWSPLGPCIASCLNFRSVVPYHHYINCHCHGNTKFLTSKGLDLVLETRQSLGGTKVRYLDLSSVHVDEYIVSFDVSVDDTLVVKVLDATCDLPCVVDYGLLIQRAPLELE